MGLPSPKGDFLQAEEYPPENKNKKDREDIPDMMKGRPSKFFLHCQEQRELAAKYKNQMPDRELKVEKLAEGVFDIESTYIKKTSQC